MTGVEEAAPLLAAGGTGAAAGTAGLTAAQWAALAASVGGTTASLIGQQQAQQERRDILNKQVARTDRAQEETNAKVVQEGQQFAPDARAQALADQTQATLAQQRADIATAAPKLIDTAGDAGAVSSDFLASKADAALSEGSRLTAIARELAKIRAPGQLQETEALRRGNLAGELSSLWGSTKADQRASQLDAENVDEPLYGSLGKLASAAGGAYLAGGGLGGGAPAASAAEFSPELSQSAYGAAQGGGGFWAPAAGGIGQVARYRRPGKP